MPPQPESCNAMRLCSEQHGRPRPHSISPCRTIIEQEVVADLTPETGPLRSDDDSTRKKEESDARQEVPPRTNRVGRHLTVQDVLHRLADLLLEY